MKIHIKLPGGGEINFRKEPSDLWWLPVAVMVIGTGGLFAFMFATI